MSKAERFITAVTEKRVQLLITTVSVAVAILNFLIVAKLQPVAQDLQAVIKRVEAIETKYVGHEEFTQVVTRLNYLTSRVDQIYSLLMR